MRLNAILISAVAVVFACKVHANNNGALVLDTGLEENNSMTWPMLPGESLNELAAKFYPDNKAMQKRFVFKTLRLNAEELPQLNPNTDFLVSTAVVIPTLKSLANSTHAIQPSHNKHGAKVFQMSYNFKQTIEKLPKGLVDEYQSLLIKNDFLKEEIKKLNEKLVFLQNKLNDLKLMLDKTLTLPKKKIFKNLDAAEQSHKASNHAAQNATAFDSDAMLDPYRRNLWFSILGVLIAIALGSYLIKKYRERAYIKFINSVTQQKAITSFDNVVDRGATAAAADQIIGAALDEVTEVDEYKDASILDEAKKLLEKDLPNDAIEHVKWAIRAQPKASIRLWLFLLKMLRQQNLKEEYEKFAFEMHQAFNVMTPLWEEKEVEMVVATSLEKFPHIIKKLKAEWPSESLKPYLERLIADNRDGERSGFGAAVVDEILTLIAVLEARDDASHTKQLI